MTSIANLNQKDREWLEEVANAYPIGSDKGQLAHYIGGDVWLAFERGEPEAERVVRAYFVNGLGEWVGAKQKEERTTVKLASGREITISARFGVQRRDENGLKEKQWGQPYVWQLTYLEAEDLLEGLMRQRDHAQRDIDAINAMLKLRDRFPDAATIEEACKMAGIDPRSFEMTG